MRRRGWWAVVLLCGLTGCESHHDDSRYRFYNSAYNGGSADAGENCRKKTERGLWKEAADICVAALADPAVTRSDRLLLNSYLVTAYSGLEDYDKALAVANDSVKLFPKDWGVLETRGGIYLALDDYDHALADYNRAIEIEPKYNHAHLGRALVYGMQGKYDLAMADLKKAAARDPDDAQVYRIRCRIEMDNGAFQPAIEDCSHALKLEPGYSVAKVERGAAQYFAADYRGAAETLADFMSYQQEEPYGLLWLHLARRRLGIDDSAQLKEQAQRIDTGRWPALIVRYYEGLVSLDAVKSATPDPDPKRAGDRACDVNYFVGEAESIAGRSDDGRHLLEQAATHCPSGHIAGVGARAALGRF